jgi:pyochelin synthetase
MDAATLITELDLLGVELWAEDGQLKFRAPKGALTEEKREQLRQHKQALLDHLTGPELPAVTADPAQAHEPFPLTDVQTAYLLGRGDSFGYGGVACHGYLEMHYPSLEPAALEAAWNRLIARHPMLRATIAADGWQQVLPSVPAYPIAVQDLRGQGAALLDQALADTRAELDHRIYPTDQWPLFTLRQTRTDDGDILHVSLDSLIADWASAGILFNELDLILAGRGDELPALEITFRDYLLAEQGLRQTSRYRRDRRYWLDRIDDLPAAPDLAQRTAPQGGAVRFHRHHGRLGKAAWESLKTQAAARGLTATTPVLAAYAAVLGRWARQPQFSLNVTLLNRFPLHPQVNQLVGDFTAVSLLAVEPAAGQHFADHAAAIGQQLFSDLDHRLFSGVEVLREITRRRGREAALMPVIFTSAIGLGNRESPASGRRPGHAITQTPQVLLDCQVMDDADGLEVNWDIRQGIFPDGMITDMFAALMGLLERLAGDEDAWDNRDPVPLPAWQGAERAAVNATATPLPDGLLHHPILQQAQATPDAVAVIDRDGSICYRDLVLWAAGLAATLTASGYQGTAPVAIILEKGAAQVAAVLGALLAGGAYLPIDVQQPALRRDRLLADAGITHVLAASSTDLPPGIIALDPATVAPASALPPVLTGNPDALAYVIYTSGSTGAPKGVMISHRAALNTIQDINRRFGIAPPDRGLGLAQLGFDLSVYDIFGLLGAGATLVLPDPARGADPSHWAGLIARHGVTFWNSVPAQMQMLASYLDAEPSPLPSLRLALLSGDWIGLSLPGQIRRHIPGLALIGLGGATEAAIWSNFHRIEGINPAWTSIPYGVPLANQGFRVLDGQMRDVPVWTAGELCITGQGLALGYLGDPALTAARFIHHPVDGQRLYRTGDLGRYLPGGEIEFLGREDGQVKIRGHRIELGEVEAALQAHPAVGAAAAVVAGTDRQDRTLLGFVEAKRRPVPPDDPRLSAEKLVPAVRRFAARQVADDHAAASQARALQEASLLTMLGCLCGHGLFNSDQATHDDETIIRQLGAVERHHWLVRRWLGLLVAADLLSRDGAGLYRRRRVVDGESVRAAWDALAGGGDGGLIAYHRAHMERLADLLAGRQNPFDLLFPEGRPHLAQAIYRDDAIARHNNHAVAALVNRIASSRDADTPLRVLEVGAGTGATSEAVIPLLDGLSAEYLFTDMTPFFLADARERFARWPWVRPALFDLNREAREQGIVPNSADIVIAAGMLNSTNDPAKAVADLAEILGPDGWLILTEPVADLPQILLTQGFMMDPAGDDRRHGGTKFRDVAGWRELIEAAGGELALCLPDEGDALAACGMRMLAARFKRDRMPVQAAELASFLGRRLPAHMVPGHIQVLDRLPLTGNGKLDRKRLAGWRPAALALAAGEADRADGEDGLTSRLCALWAEALGLPRLEPTDNFYDKGADSLILARVAGRLREEVAEAAPFPYDTLLRQMLNEPTVAALVQALRRGELAETTAAGTASPALPADQVEGSNAKLIAFGGEGPVARVMFHAALGTMDYFQHLGRSMAAQGLGPVIGIAVADIERYLALEPKKLIEAVADDYASRLIAAGHRHFQLVGYCLGGLLATEVARRLLDRGMDVRDLTLVDSIPMFIETEEELAFEAIFVPNLNLDPVAAVFGPDVPAADVYRAIEKLTLDHARHIPAGAMAALTGDAGLDAVAAAARRRMAVPQAERLAGYAAAIGNQAGVPVGPELVPGLFRVCRHSMRAARFDPPPYVGDMTYLRCLEQQSFGITAGVGHLAVPFWEGVCLGDFKVIDVPGNHFSVVEPPHVDIVTAHLAAALRGR